MKKFTLFFISFVFTLFAFCFVTNAAEITSDAVLPNGERQVSVSPNGDEDATSLINKIMNDCGDNKLSLTLSPGEYHISSTLQLYNNTDINASGATVYQDTNGKGILINARRLDGAQNGKGGYKSLKNVNINGGTWVCKAKPDKSKTFKDSGYYVGYSTFLFLHGENISVNSCSFKNNYNGHFVEFAGVNNGKVTNCNMNVKGSVYVGESSNEAIQIDNTFASSNSPVGAPWDDTASKNITVKNCNIRFARGIGTNRIGKSFYKNINIENCKIVSDNEGINIYDTLGVKINKCNVKSNGKKDDYTSSAIYIGLDDKLSSAQKKKSVTKISNSTAKGLHAGVKICVPANNTKFGTVEVKNNKFYSSKSKNNALRLSYGGKQITKLVNKNNKLKKG
ncbi:MAG: hypothetical protein PUE60_02110 [Eubacteriales bacterium]|nr:hypothetical protein [Eubacteriales bacterium]